MTHTDLARIDEQLRTELATILDERRAAFARQLEQLTEELGDGDADDDAQPGDTQLLRARLDDAATSLRHVDRALARLAHRDFGACEVCATTIAADRLRALPDTARCTTCAGLP